MKNDSVINLKEALAVFSLRDEKGMVKHFNLTYRTFNSATKKGGKLISYNGVKYLPSAKKETLTVKETNHFQNRTRNIELPTGDLKKVKIDFIISVNDKKVIY